VEQDSDPEVEMVPCITAPLPDAKQIVAACEEEDIEAMLARADCCGKSGCACAPKIQVLVAKQDVPRLAKMINERWRQSLEREGTLDEGVFVPAQAAAEPEGEHPPCPACGTAAPLVEGNCSDCGLHLE
jgi:hypothetical protein